MGETTEINWAHSTFNPWRGCTKVSDGCTNCYAEQMSGRNHKTLGEWGKYGFRAIAAESYWKQPEKWHQDAIKAGERRRVFCASLADVFEGYDTMPEASHEPVKLARRRLFKLITATPQLDWLLLTKRPENIRKLIYEAIDPFDDPDSDYNIAAEPNGLDVFSLDELYPNIWFGVSVEHQTAADERREDFRKLEAAVKFVSYEPSLGAVDWTGWEFLSQIISGGESGSKARPSHPDWHRETRDFCQKNGIAYLFKQWGEYVPASESPNPIARLMSADDYWAVKSGGVRPVVDQGINPHGVRLVKVGKKKAGRLLDGCEWTEFPV